MSARIVFVPVVVPRATCSAKMDSLQTAQVQQVKSHPSVKQTSAGPQQKSRPMPAVYKTILCKHYMSTRRCPLGITCGFAHGYHELRRPPPLDVVCRYGLSCPYGARCQYSHVKDSDKDRASRRASLESSGASECESVDSGLGDESWDEKHVGVMMCEKLLQDC